VGVLFGEHYCGCGFCGAMQPEEQGWPDCCPRMIEWKRRLFSGIAAHDYCEEPPIEQRAMAMRWERVARRLASKHTRPRALPAPLR
jgi:hypothetical protein